MRPAADLSHTDPVTAPPAPPVLPNRTTPPNQTTSLPRGAPARWLVNALVAGGLMVVLGGCGGGEPADATSTPSASAPATASGAAASAADTDARTQLAALAAAAEDRHLRAYYTLSRSGRPNRTVAVTSATDGTWRVDIPGGALGGTADIAMAQTRNGIYQCALPSAARPDPSTCVRVAAPDKPVPASIDPRVQRVFTDWRSVLTDRQASLAVSTTKALPNSRGTCFSVDSTAASLSAPLEIGIYCFDTDGTLTAARVAFGTLLLVGDPTPAPATVTLPGPVVAGSALRTAAPPTPSVEATSTGTPTR
ncbi:hypothetical protein ACI2K4_15515 [Micromonospora sp. NPDC050397]|uniref:hypothetical protein n=1 Tax=Micromonospora sp. NPDC050397 TaxID=3364279 RepID=UPI00384D3847